MQGNDVQSDDVQGGGVQRMAVFPLGELRPRPSWCAGRSRVVREELQCGGCGSGIARDGHWRPSRRRQRKARP
jgi:hypothetical protein